jgi:CubicO group peptidase (beta-lactamase class C family)
MVGHGMVGHGMVGRSGVRGHIAAGYEPVRDALTELAATDTTYCAQFCAYEGAEPVVDLTCGPWADDALLPVFSSSKGAIGVTIALLVQRGVVDLDAPVAEYWPEFAAAGKAEITVRQLLSHQGGLPGVDGGYRAAELLAHEPLSERLAAQRPFWRPGSAFAYHPITIGTLADELVRRTTGRTLNNVFRSDVAEPMGIDVHMGTAQEMDSRVVPVDLPTPEELTGSGMSDLPVVEPDSLRALTTPCDAPPLWTWANEEEYRRVGPPAAGGLATARGLARMYAVLGEGVAGSGRLLDEDVIAQMTQIQVDGPDLLSGLPLRYGIVFQRPVPPRLAYGSFQAFGHDGLGGAVGVYDPFHRLAFGYTVKRIPLPGGCDSRAIELMRHVRAVHTSIAGG